jgi:alpha-muurolene/germacrene-A/gamma-muurolene/(+)-delta-cadinol synthase
MHNLVAIIMNNDNLDLQGAMDRAGDMCRAALDKYIETKAKFPSYGAEIDNQVATFLRGLESWISGSLEWSFVTPRYFGNKRHEVKKTRWVKLLSRSRVTANAA